MWNSTAKTLWPSLPEALTHGIVQIFHGFRREIPQPLNSTWKIKCKLSTAVTWSTYFCLLFSGSSGGKTPTCLLNAPGNAHDPCDRSHGSDPDDWSLSGTCHSWPFVLPLASTDHPSWKKEQTHCSPDNKCLLILFFLPNQKKEN